MIIVTGAAGFIGSYLIKRLNEDNFNAIIAVDLFDNVEKNKNLVGLKIQERVNRDEFLSWLDQNNELVEFVFHIGARTDTTEFDSALLNRLNTQYTKDLWQKCCRYQLPLVYASSAATYGLGEMGYDDDESKIELLKPLNPYGQSKQDFDVWALKQKEKPFFWAGLKFFNVYGPNEYHKGRMASVKDVAEVCMFLMHHRKNSGIYNLGSGKARTFNDLAKAVFAALDKPANIEYIDTPVDIRDTYQYFTEANMGKLTKIGYQTAFSPLEQGIKTYIEGIKHPIANTSKP
jgi:ADP-L-glycero-D-manno-heptose 6-epimerase